MSQTAVHFEGGPTDEMTVVVNEQNERVAAFLLDLYTTGCEPAPIAHDADIIPGEAGAKDTVLPGAVHAPEKLTIPEDVSVERFKGIFSRIGSVTITERHTHPTAA